jgi:sugar phosphate isomerase/epimerase
MNGGAERTEHQLALYSFLREISADRMEDGRLMTAATSRKRPALRDKPGASATRTKPLRVGMTTYGYLFQATLESCLESIARAGYKLVEIAPVSPHLPVGGFDWLQRKRLKRLLDDQGLTCVSINPAELNLFSPNADLREVALRQYRQSIALAHDLGAPIVNVVPGRAGVLISMPARDARELALQQLPLLLKDAHEYGVSLALETVPFGLIRLAAELAALVRAIGDKRLGICVDVANIHGHEDVRKTVSSAGPLLMMAHLSDTWRHRFAHTSLGRGEVDFAGYLAALREQKFHGPCVYELVDGEDPDPRIGADLVTLKKWGWSA